MRLFCGFVVSLLVCSFLLKMSSKKIPFQIFLLSKTATFPGSKLVPQVRASFSQNPAALTSPRNGVSPTVAGAPGALSCPSVSDDLVTRPRDAVTLPVGTKAQTCAVSSCDADRPGQMQLWRRVREGLCTGVSVSTPARAHGGCPGEGTALREDSPDPPFCWGP